jgi:hypothetical protein
MGAARKRKLLTLFEERRIAEISVRIDMLHRVMRGDPRANFRGEGALGFFSCPWIKDSAVRVVCRVEHKICTWRVTDLVERNDSQDHCASRLAHSVDHRPIILCIDPPVSEVVLSGIPAKAVTNIILSAAAGTIRAIIIQTAIKSLIVASWIGMPLSEPAEALCEGVALNRPQARRSNAIAL